MKKLFILIVMTTAIFGCQSNIKQNEGVVKKQADSAEAESRGIDSTYKSNQSIAIARVNYDLFYHTCANGYADQTSGSEGLAASVNVEKLRLGNARIKSWWIGAYYNITLPNGTVERDWVQWGYFVDRSGLDQAFYVYSISPIYGQKWPLTIINQNPNAPALTAGARVRFEIKHVDGTTFWSFLRDGQKIFDVDLGTTSFDGTLQSCTESWGNNTFSNILHVDYLDMYKNGVWSHLPSGNIGSIEWKLEGSRQRPEFKQSEHEFGGKLGTISDYLLW